MIYKSIEVTIVFDIYEFILVHLVIMLSFVTPASTGTSGSGKNSVVNIENQQAISCLIY